MQDKFLYFDTETTDTQAKDLLQLAFLTDNPDIKLNLYFKPKQEISFGAMAVHNITPEMIKDKKYFEDTPFPKENIDPEFTGDDLIEYLKLISKIYMGSTQCRI